MSALQYCNSPQGIMEEEIFLWILILIAMKLPFLPSVRSMRRVQGRQTKLHPGLTLGKLMRPSLGISILRDSHIVLSKRS